MHMRGQMYDRFASRDRRSPICIRIDVSNGKRWIVRPIRCCPGGSANQVSLQIQGRAQCTADKARCPCDQNGGQSDALARTTCRDGLLVVIGSLWQTGLMLHDVIRNRDRRIVPF